MVIRAEGFPGNYGNVRFGEQAFSELVWCRNASAAQNTADIGIGVERAIRHGAGDARDLAEAGDDECPAPAIFGEHRAD